MRLIFSLVGVLVAGKIVNRLAHVFGAAMHRVDHAGDDERGLDFVGTQLRLIVLVRYQIARTHWIRYVAVRMVQLGPTASPVYGPFASAKISAFWL